MSTEVHPFDALKALLQKDPNYAWTFHCAVTHANLDGGHLKWKEANEAACRVMFDVFGVDTSPEFVKLLKQRSPNNVQINC